MKLLFFLLAMALRFGLPDQPAFAEPASPGPFELNFGRYGMPAVALDSCVYVAGGCGDEGARDDVECLIPERRAAQVYPTSLLPRFFHAGAVLEGRLILVGGLTKDRRMTGLVEAFHTSGKVTALPPLPEPVARPGVAVHEDRLYVIGGEKADRKRTGMVQIYDGETKTWSQGAEMPVAREGMVVVKDGQIYAPGGYNGKVAITDFQVYDLTADRWERRPDLPVKMSAHSGVIVGHTLYTFGDYEVLNRAAACDLETGEWALLDIGYRSSRHNAAVRHGDEVLVIGGNTSPRRPFLNYIQRFPIEQLAAAPRRPWTADHEPKPEPRPETPPQACRAAAAAGGPPVTAFSLSGHAAPDFELRLFDDSLFRLADHTGRVVVLDFWATWCAPCRRALPHMAALAEAYKDKDVVFLGISQDRSEDRAKVRAFLAQHEAVYPTGLDLQGLGRTYAVRGIPCVVLIGRDGRVQGRLVGFGAGTAERLRDAIERLRAGEELASVSPSEGEEAAALPPLDLRERTPLLEAAQFQLKWRREGAPRDPTEPGRVANRVELIVPQRRLVLEAAGEIRVLDVEHNEIRAVFRRPEDAQGPDTRGKIAEFIPLQDGSKNIVVVIERQFKERRSIGDEQRLMPKALLLRAFSEAGKVLWERTVEGLPAALLQAAAALPLAQDREGLLLITFNQLILLDARGETILEQPCGFRDRLRIEWRADGRYDVLVLGEEVAAYEWRPALRD